MLIRNQEPAQSCPKEAYMLCRRTTPSTGLPQELEGFTGLKHPSATTLEAEWYRISFSKTDILFHLVSYIFLTVAYFSFKTVFLNYSYVGKHLLTEFLAPWQGEDPLCPWQRWPLVFQGLSAVYWHWKGRGGEIPSDPSAAGAVSLSVLPGCGDHCLPHQTSWCRDRLAPKGSCPSPHFALIDKHNTAIFFLY